MPRTNNLSKELEDGVDISKLESSLLVEDNIKEGTISSPELKHAIEKSSLLGWEFNKQPDISLIDSTFSSGISFRQARLLGFIPVYSKNQRVVIWLRPDICWNVWMALQAEYGKNVIPEIITESSFNRALQQAFKKTSVAADAIEDMDDVIDLSAATVGLQEDLLDSQDDAPIIRLLNAILAQAIEEGASDIHVEPLETNVVIRYRVDGVLRDVVEPSSKFAGRISARIKVMARLNIAERRVPQDGRMSLRLAGRLIDIRVSTLPTYYGERVVMRILEKEAGPLTLGQIGMSTEIASQLKTVIRSPHGIFLVTGPTGSGKTTTLYASLQQVRNPDVNIITIEDPVEYDLEGIGQTPVNVKTGMTFSRGLRAILRQDPDVIMVGEVRDLETAQVSVQASLTGHLVFSTLHTNDAIGSVTRLIDMGIESYLVASSLLGVMGQRLVRKLCLECRSKKVVDEGERTLLSIDDSKSHMIYYPKGCERCGHTGYQGRTGIYELMLVSDEIKRLIHDCKGEQLLREVSKRNGMRTLREDGILKVLGGITSLEEVLRVTQN